MVLRIEEHVLAPADGAASLIYASVHELMSYMFVDQQQAEKVLAKLYRKNKGHFSHVFSTAAFLDNTLVGIELGYDRQQLAKQNLPGSVYMLFCSPVSRWWHLAVNTGGVLEGYVLPPSEGCYYMNNLAVHPLYRGKRIGQQLMEHRFERAKQQGYGAVELDVTSVNGTAIALYSKLGFKEISRSGSEELHKTHGLPPLVRMQYPLK